MDIRHCIYKNLLREANDAGMGLEDLALRLNVSDNVLMKRLSGAPPGFSLRELRIIKELFPYCTLDYLLLQRGEQQ